MKVLYVLLWTALCWNAWADDSVQDWIDRGDRHDRRRQTAEAISAYEKANGLSPSNAEVLWRLSKQYCLTASTRTVRSEKAELLQKALGLARDAVQANPRNANAHIAVAICYAKQMEISDHKTQIRLSRLIRDESEESLRIDPDLEMGYHMLGRWHYELASLNPLLKGFAKLIYGNLPDGTFESAAENFKKAIELNSHRVMHHELLARTYLAMGNRDFAVKELQKASHIKPLDHDDEESKNAVIKLLSSLEQKRKLHPKYTTRQGHL